YSAPRLAEYFQRLGLSPAGEAEVNLDALDLMSGVYQRLARGRVLTIDYGCEAEELYLRHPQGTFMTYLRHTAGGNPYENVGLQDMTSHVDFTSIMRLGEAHGFRTTMFTTQAEFLAQCGIGQRLVDLQGKLSAEDYGVAREAAVTLLNPAGMGGFRVLVQER